MRSASRALLASVLVLALAACSGSDGSTAALEDNLSAQEQALEALRERVDGLVDSVQSVQSTDPMSELSGVRDQLEELAGRLQSVEDDVAEELASEDETVQANAERLQELAADVDDVSSTLDDLDSTLSDLTSRVEDLEQRLAEHEQDHPTDGSQGGDES